MSETKPALEINNVVHGYDGNMVLNEVNLILERNEICALLGPSGCGKSTLLRILTGQEKPDRGNIKINGKLVTGPSRNCGIIFQDNTLFPHLSVIENIHLGKKFLKTKSSQSQQSFSSDDEILSLLNIVGLHEHQDKFIHELSGGMRQRVALVQSLVTRPDVLLMDEPFAALDPTTREEAQQLLLTLQKEYQICILLVTHDFFEAAILGKHIAVLSQYHGSAKSGSKIVRVFENEMRTTQVKPSLRQTKIYKLIADIKRTGFGFNNDFELDYI